MRTRAARADDRWDSADSDYEDSCFGRNAKVVHCGDETQVHVSRPASARRTDGSVETRPDPARKGWVIDVLIAIALIFLFIFVYSLSAGIITFDQGESTQVVYVFATALLLSST